MLRSTLLLTVVLITCASCGGRPATASKQAAWVSGPTVGSLDLLAVDLIDSRTGWAAGEIDPGGVGGVIYQTLMIRICFLLAPGPARMS